MKIKLIDVKLLCAGIDNKNQYLQHYISGLNQSFSLYGITGLKAQIGYILANLIARTENDKEIKAKLKDMINGEKNELQNI